MREREREREIEREMDKHDLGITDSTLHQNDQIQQSVF